MPSQLDVSPSKVAPRGKDPAQRVYIKFLVFSITLFVAPLSAFFLAKDRWLDGNATYAGGLAAIVVNIVLVAYIVSAFLEDKDDAAPSRTATTKTTTAGEAKKDK
ncbi:uncharacterized protein PFL1_05942 [Pseudozyma flocculosa PF-1]|uniref:Related to VMA21 - ATPase assembly integral membrane protein n=2 Tax=Pseudozyma flocculosa TaxID=84751 RepID=A0A5C3F1J4_9BASI|nr:uncharacterized protein PFL1_05942 [Pseudozyma flocculosa PF-1]EPQ26621.1 hypothetical protein PFL1_05942 [Pseudozyma flocculosa PF-1]SPO38383.1 related to VMA21 - ATPase assembly integral membrane protein [Pseudozyma flocculosa]